MPHWDVKHIIGRCDVKHIIGRCEVKQHYVTDKNNNVSFKVLTYIINSIAPRSKHFLSNLFYSYLYFFHNALRYWLDIWYVGAYNDKLPIKFTFHSGPVIFGRVMAFGLWNLAKYLVVSTFFHYDLRYWLDFWYESV